MKMKELETDFFAGFYLGHFKGNNQPVEDQEFTLEFINTLGDVHESDSDDPHGTGEERQDALSYGYEVSQDPNFIEMDRAKFFSLRSMFIKKFQFGIK